MNKHRTKRIALKWIDVDEKIVPLVDWLNGFDSVHTEFSCQGDDKGDDPYVLFKCRHDGDLATILEAFEAFGEGRLSELRCAWITLETACVTLLASLAAILCLNSAPFYQTPKRSYSAK